MIMENNKKSKLIFDMRIARRLLKRNPTIEEKYCRYCGKLLTENCECVQPFTVIDVKPLRGHPGSTVAIFEDTPEFRVALEEVSAGLKNKE